MAVLIEVYTQSHRIRGQADTGNVGLFGFLNRPTESLVELVEAEISALHELNKPAEQSTRMWLVKEEIVAILVQHKGELGPSSSTRGGYTKPFPHWVRITLSGYVLRGQVLSGGRFDVGPLLFDGDSLFSSLFEGEIAAVLFPKAASKAPAMAFNRKMVHSLALMNRDEIPGGSNPDS